ncbi:MAG TPA: FAD:protein FMN transferase, partial [Mycobacteriales bacterium]|nr:FAD:protein FMN transferase [Mycobacteriales bacterium]
PTSDLMRANRDGESWVRVDPLCFDALIEAFAAHRRTHGRFDPRVLADLVRLGYDVSWTRQQPRVADVDRALSGRAPLAPWQPEFRAATCEVKVGPHPIDLGGIGKGLAVRWASGRLRANGLSNYFVEAGGDVACAGVPADAPGWRVSVEDPLGGSEPVAVLELCDEAAATSSVRLRSWRVGGRKVHHLIDPRTGEPGGDGLLAVTVADPDPARAEVWSKVLFLTGRTGVATTAALYNLPALWVDTEGALGASAALGRRLIWSSG